MFANLLVDSVASSSVNGVFEVEAGVVGKLHVLQRITSLCVTT